MLQDTTLLLHIVGGMVGVVAGYAALTLRKGARPHRVAGNVFVVSMLLMGGLAAVLGLRVGQTGNAFGGVFVCYLVGSGWAAVRRRPGRVGRPEAAGFVFAVGIAATAPLVGALPPEPAAMSGEPAQGPYLLAALAGLAAALDLRMLRRGGLVGFERIRRHLWRMCAALFVATGSFFLGQREEIPAALHGPHLFVLALGPLAALLFWMLRTRLRRAPQPLPAVS